MQLFRILLWVMIIGTFCGCTTEAVNRDQMVYISKVAHRTQLRLADLNLAVKRDRNNAALYAKRAFLYLQANNPVKALADINRAIDLDEQQEEYFFRKAIILRGAGQSAAALEAATEAERLGYTLPDSYLLQGELLLKLNKYQEALIKINTALKSVPTNEYALFYKASAQVALTDTVAGVVNFKKALGYAPDFKEAYLQLISIYNNQKQFDLARDYISLAEKLDQNNAFLLYQKGLTYLGTHFPDSAYASLTKALTFDPNLHLAYYELGKLTYKRKDYPEAIRYLEKLSSGRKKYPRVPEMLAESYEKTQQFKPAIRYYSSILKTKPNDVWAGWGVRRSTYGLYKLSRDSIYEAQIEARNLEINKYQIKE